MGARGTYKRKELGSTLKDRVAELMAEEIPPAAIAVRLGVSVRSVHARISTLIKTYGG